jgi:hypothetical protein
MFRRVLRLPLFHLEKITLTFEEIVSDTDIFRYGKVNMQI